MTFCITALSSFLMMVGIHVADEDVLNTALYFAPLIFQVLKSQWLIIPYTGDEIPYLLDTGPNILPSLM